jgi:hypothetical protein
LGEPHASYVGPKSREELDFIGSYEQRRSERGWHQPGQLAALRPLYEVGVELSPKDTSILQSLMTVGSQEGLEFLG